MPTPGGGSTSVIINWYSDNLKSVFLFVSSLLSFLFFEVSGVNYHKTTERLLNFCGSCETNLVKPRAPPAEFMSVKKKNDIILIAKFVHIQIIKIFVRFFTHIVLFSRYTLFTEITLIIQRYKFTTKLIN